MTDTATTRPSRPTVVTARPPGLVPRILKGVRTYVNEHHGWLRASRDLAALLVELMRTRGVTGLFPAIREYLFYVNSFSRPDLNAASGDRGRGVTVRPAAESHSASVTIIVCVHNALSDVRRCLESVFAWSTSPYELVLVDDGSDEETARYLAEVAKARGAHLIRNEAACGYTLAANQGLRAARGDFALLLNSDTIVTPHWLDRLLACAESDPGIGLAGPLSNTASWQSIPEIEQQGDWAENRLPDGLDIAGMGELLGRHSARLYPRVAFLNGFCLLIRRAVIDQIGYFDEEGFGRGYGEENDYCLRARNSGWSLAVADDAYVYHAQSRSYSSERRTALAALAGRTLAAKHGLRAIEEGIRSCRHDRVLEGIRAGSRALLERWAVCRAGRERWRGKRLMFILPVPEAGGGSNVVIREALAMREMGIDACVLNLEAFRQPFTQSYPGLSERIPLIFAPDDQAIPALAAPFDAVIATTSHSVGWLERNGVGPVRGYYIQDFEPYFFPEGTKNHRIALDSYGRFPNLVRFTKTEWNREELLRQTGLDAAVVGADVDLDLFRPRPRTDGNWPDRPLRVAAMIRPSTPRRAAGLTMEVLRRAARSHGDDLEIILFGCLADDPAFLALPHDFPWRHEGKLLPGELARLFNEVDIFADFSAFQAMGLTAMEAMACGAAVIVPENGGATSFAVHGRNALVVDTASPEACLAALERLIGDHDLRGVLQRRAVADIVTFFPERAAFNILRTLFSDGSDSR